MKAESTILPKAVSNPVAVYAGFAVGFLLSVMAAIYMDMTAVVAIPFVLIGCLYLLQRPVLLFYILIAAIPWSVEFTFNNTLGTDLPDEPLMLLTAGAVVLWMLYQKRFRKITSIHPLLWLLLLQWIWAAISTYFSTYPVISVKFLLAKSWYLAAFVAAPLLLWQNEKVIKNTFAILLVSMLLATSVAFIRHAAYGFTFENINTALRPFFRNHVNYSALLAGILPIAIAGWQLSKKRKRVYIILFVFLATAIYFSYARGAWLAAIIGIGSYWLIRKKLLLASFVLFVVLSLSTLLWLRQGDRYLGFAHNYRTTIFHTNFKQHLIATYELKDVSTAERFYRWIAGVRMIKDGWQTGFGPATFYNNYKPYTIPLFRTWVSRNEEHSTVHNYFLLTIIEQGVMGLLLLLGLIGYSFYTAQKIYHRTLEPFWKAAAAAIAALLWVVCTVNFLSDLIETDKVGSLFYLCLALLVIADRKTKPSQRAISLPTISV